jgi:hypothetical protein
MAISKSGEVAGYAAETGADQAFTRDASGTFFTFEAPGGGFDRFHSRHYPFSINDTGEETGHGKTSRVNLGFITGPKIFLCNAKF